MIGIEVVRAAGSSNRGGAVGVSVFESLLSGIGLSAGRAFPAGWSNEVELAGAGEAAGAGGLIVSGTSVDDDGASVTLLGFVELGAGTIVPELM